MKREKGYLGGIILLIILLLLTVSLVLLVVYNKKANNILVSEENDYKTTKEDIKNLEEYLNNNKDVLSKINFSLDENGKVVLLKTKNLLTSATEQSLTFEYLKRYECSVNSDECIKNNINYLYVDKNTLIETTTNNENSLTYLSLDDFNIAYYYYFNKKTTNEHKINSTYNTLYDKEGYVFYNDLGIQDKYKIESFKVLQLVQEDKNNIYSAKVEVKYNPDLTKELDTDMSTVIIQYNIKDNNIHLTEYRIK